MQGCLMHASGGHRELGRGSPMPEPYPRLVRLLWFPSWASLWGQDQGFWNLPGCYHPSSTTRKERFPLSLSALIRLRIDFDTWPQGDQPCPQKKGHCDWPSLSALPAPPSQGGNVWMWRAVCNIGFRSRPASRVLIQGSMSPKIWSVDQAAACRDRSHHLAHHFLYWKSFYPKTNKKVCWTKECAQWHMCLHVCGWCLWKVLLQILKMQKGIKTPHVLSLPSGKRDRRIHRQLPQKNNDGHDVKAIKHSPEWRIYVLIQKRALGFVRKWWIMEDYIKN